MTTLLGVDFAEYIVANINLYVLIHYQKLVRDHLIDQ